MNVFIIIIGVLLLQYVLKILRNYTYFTVFLGREFPIVWIIIWLIVGFLVMYSSTLYKTDLLGLEIALPGSFIFFISSLLKKMPTIKPEDDTIMKRALSENGYADFEIPNANIYYRVGIIAFAVTAVITWIAFYATSTV